MKIEDLTVAEEKILAEIKEGRIPNVLKNDKNYESVLSLQRRGLITLAGDEQCEIRDIYLTERGMKYIKRMEEKVLSCGRDNGCEWRR